MVLVIDNYDSFTYNLVQYLGELGAEIRVRRNDDVSLADRITSYNVCYTKLLRGARGRVRSCGDCRRGWLRAVGDGPTGDSERRSA